MNNPNPKACLWKGWLSTLPISLFALLLFVSHYHGNADLDSRPELSEVLGHFMVVFLLISVNGILLGLLSYRFSNLRFLKLGGISFLLFFLNSFLLSVYMEFLTYMTPGLDKTGFDLSAVLKSTFIGVVVFFWFYPLILILVYGLIRWTEKQHRQIHS